jgi:hypothetical protein
MVRTLVASVLFVLLSFPAMAPAQVISGPEVKINGGDIYVTFHLDLGPKHEEELREGIDKELKFYTDLFRVWKVWPDEFVTGRMFTRTLKVDPIKGEFVSTSLNGNVLVERRFKSFQTMLKWALSVKDLKLVNVRDLEPGQYFVKVTVESKVRKLPPVIGYLFIFVSENDFKISKDSPAFMVEGR